VLYAHSYQLFSFLSIGLSVRRPSQFGSVLELASGLGGVICGVVSVCYRWRTSSAFSWLLLCLIKFVGSKNAVGVCVSVAVVKASLICLATRPGCHQVKRIG